MKTKILLAITMLFVFGTAFGQGTAFTYQGRLNDGSGPAHGSYDFRFKLFADPDGNTQVGSAILTNGYALSNGLFAVALDFGPGIFRGSNYWLEVDVRTNGGGGYSNLNPLQSILPTPYAMFANTASNVSGTISSLSLSGTYGNAVVFNNSNNSFGGSFSGNGASVTNVNAVALNGLRASNFWNTAGNAGTSAGSNFVGTTDNQPLELRVNNQRALRLTPDSSTNNSPDLIGGSPVNTVKTGVVGATIAGGGAALYSGLPGTNMVLGDFDVIGGGWGNTAGSTNLNVTEATVAGGGLNTASGISSAIGGGAQNLAYDNNATVAGGYFNRASFHSGVLGGFQNLADGLAAVIGGGHYNNIQSNVYIAVIGGGYFNSVQGGNSEAGAVIGGGALNSIQPSSLQFEPLVGLIDSFSTIAGGLANVVQSNSIFSTIAGGKGNSVGTNSPGSTIGGGTNNFVQPGSVTCTISGGMSNSVQGFASAIGGGFNNTNTSFASFLGGGQGNFLHGDGAVLTGGYFNTNSASSGTIGGGQNNFVGGLADHGTIAGGGGNSIIGAAGLPVFGTIGGGSGNSIQTNVSYGSIGGGVTNTIQTSAHGATIAGGAGNVVSSLGQDSAIGGGTRNTGNGPYATIPGGFGNMAGANAFAAGTSAQAAHLGSFVWADSQGPTYTSDRNNQFRIRAGGGVIIDVSGSSGLNPAAFYVNSSSSTGVGIYVAESSSDAALVLNNSGTGSIIKGFNGGGNAVFEVVHDGTVFSKGLALTSDRNAKENFEQVNSREILEKVAALAISEWNYKTDRKELQHLGPTAQDFHEAFRLDGDDDKHISVVDEGGVALAAIQGLNHKLEDGSQKSEVRMQKLETENAELRQRLEKIEKLLNADEQKGSAR